MHITAIVLTFNEEIHIARCISSIKKVADDIIIVDSFSSDATKEVAESLEAKVIRNKWTTHARQFNWALEQMHKSLDWVLRIDADEYLTPNLIDEIVELKKNGPKNACGFYMNRYIKFQGRIIKHGGIFPSKILRLFQYKNGKCEDRLMDEHILVEGPCKELSAPLIDDSLQTLSWWTEKHNSYSNKEAFEILNIKYNIRNLINAPHSINPNRYNRSRNSRRRIYGILPPGGRAIFYFIYRYFFRLGILDGKQGLIFHLLQGLWYRFLVDAKVAEVERHIIKLGSEPKNAIKTILSIECTQID